MSFRPSQDYVFCRLFSPRTLLMEDIVDSIFDFTDLSTGMERLVTSFNTQEKCEKSKTYI